MATRSAWRLPFVKPFFFSNSFLRRKSIKTSQRSLTVPFLPTIGRSFYVYNGQKHLQVIYKKEMVGFKLGSFALTKVIGHVPKVTKKRAQQKR
jgi:ribosomal protein S19